MTDRIVYEDDRVIVLVREKAKPPTPTPTPPPSAPKPTPPAVSRLYELVNQHRAKTGGTPLARDVEAERIAQGWAEEMARTGDFHHNPNVAADLGDPWYGVGENIAWGYVDEATVHQAWLDSPPHRRNIEGPAYTALGVGRAMAAGGRLYWCEVFVDRQP